MITRMIAVNRLALISLVTAALGGCASWPGDTQSDVHQRIEVAHTPADHQGLVRYYLREGTAARIKAAEHRRMANSYQGGIAGGNGAANVADHCYAIVRLFEDVAKEYDAMAQYHQLLANVPALSKP